MRLIWLLIYCVGLTSNNYNLELSSARSIIFKMNYQEEQVSLTGIGIFFQ